MTAIYNPVILALVTSQRMLGSEKVFVCLMSEAKGGSKRGQ